MNDVMLETPAQQAQTSRMQLVYVSLAERSYVITVGENMLREVGISCSKLNLGPRCAIITDSKVAHRYAKPLDKALKLAGFEPGIITIPSGEKSKNLKMVQSCYDELAKMRLDRKSMIVALGGGVVGDLAGFVAATYLRGIAFVQVPTTLLAQVDSSVGGKVGVNLKAGKNLVGAFHQPRFVSCDLQLLKSLPAREFRSGLAEVIKYGIIANPNLFDRLEVTMDRVLAQDPEVLPDIVAQCCQTKADIVAADETETGLRSILNFGHTIGHAIEAISGYGKYLHGEAIAIGQVAAAKLSSRLTGLGLDAVDRIEKLFKAAGLPTQIKLTKVQYAKLLDAMLLDKKTSGGEVKFVLAEQIGKVRFGEKVPVQHIQEVMFPSGK
jgi:3-dehydroquinate synthase